jgi:hypothetical protein
MQILDIPDDILLDIIGYLDNAEYINFCLTCIQFRDIAEIEPHLQFMERFKRHIQVKNKAYKFSLKNKIDVTTIAKGVSTSIALSGDKVCKFSLYLEGEKYIKIDAYPHSLDIVSDIPLQMIIDILQKINQKDNIKDVTERMVNICFRIRKSKEPITKKSSIVKILKSTIMIYDTGYVMLSAKDTESAMASLSIFVKDHIRKMKDKP